MRKLIKRVDPVYPSWARIEGTVRFQLIIGADGRVQDVKFVSGHPLLVKRHWHPLPCGSSSHLERILLP
jgi:hypothetical protein